MTLLRVDPSTHAATPPPSTPTSNRPSSDIPPTTTPDSPTNIAPVYEQNPREKVFQAQFGTTDRANPFNVNVLDIDKSGALNAKDLNYKPNQPIDSARNQSALDWAINDWKTKGLADGARITYSIYVDNEKTPIEIGFTKFGQGEGDYEFFDLPPKSSDSGNAGGEGGGGDSGNPTSPSASPQSIPPPRQSSSARGISGLDHGIGGPQGSGQGDGGLQGAGPAGGPSPGRGPGSGFGHTEGLGQGTGPEASDGDFYGNAGGSQPFELGPAPASHAPLNGRAFYLGEFKKFDSIEGKKEFMAGLIKMYRDGEMSDDEFLAALMAFEKSSGMPIKDLLAEASDGSEDKEWIEKMEKIANERKEGEKELTEDEQKTLKLSKELNGEKLRKHSKPEADKTDKSIDPESSKQEATPKDDAAPPSVPTGSKDVAPGAPPAPKSKKPADPLPIFEAVIEPRFG